MFNREISLPPALSYDGKSAVVAGGGGDGMGAAVVQILLSLGANVTVLDLRASASSDAEFIRTDLGSVDEIDQAISEIGDVDALFNCQGISGATPGASVSEVMTVNFLGLRHLTEAIVPKMPPGSAVANISSAGGLGWERKSSEIQALLEHDDTESAKAWCEQQSGGMLKAAFPHAYAFSKQALIYWTLQRSESSIQAGIRMNVTSPGSTLTPMAGDFPVTGVEGMNHPINRTSVPVEQAWPLVYLNGSAASYVNGVNIPVDGGNFAARSIARLTRDS